MWIPEKLKRVRALVDTSAWLMIAPCAIAIYFIDGAMFKTLIQWLLFAPIITGVAVIVSRIMFPQIHLTDLVAEVKTGNTAAGILGGALVLFVALLVIALVIWAKA
ncbi:hypothetical protein [Pseudomonas sp.]|uniref:hypothetical protein n=1 Tax=Pseudomonas sp. TaxID=306 RepID=UPI003FD88C15